MAPLMPGRGALLAVPLAAERAAKRFLARVDPLVHEQVARRAALFLAVLTDPSHLKT